MSPNGRRTWVVVLACASSLLLSGCLSATRPAHTPGVTPLIPGATPAEYSNRADLGYGTFHHFIYIAYQAGHLDKHYPHDLASAVSAATYVYQQLQLAGSLAESTGRLQKTYHPLATLASHLGFLSHQIKRGDLGGIPVIEAEFQVLRVASLAGGVAINERVDDSFTYRPQPHRSTHRKSGPHPPVAPYGPYPLRS
jgi:hypothetical protein